MPELAKIDRSESEIVRMKDLGELVTLSIKASALEAVIRRTGKFAGRDYYRVARAALWAEWRAGQLLREVERHRPSFQPGTITNSLIHTLEIHKLKKSTAYRWMTMSWAAHADVAAYFAKQEAATQPIKRSDVVRLGRAAQPVDEVTTEAEAGDQTCQIIHGDLADAPVADSSVDCIITDPPYPEEFLAEYRKLSAFAARVLKPGGSCLAMAGHSYLPEVVAAMAQDLTYHWTVAYLTPGGQSVQVWPRHVNVSWKPLFWFVKGAYDGAWVGDVIKSDVNDNDKRFHEWGQSESGFSRIVERFSRPDDLVVDPFVGGGTTAIAALTHGRRFIGIDRDATAVKETRLRIARMKREAVA